MRPPPAHVNDPIETIATPALVVDLDALERNLDAMAAWARSARDGRGIRLRPHAKTHKCAEIARLQIARGAVGVCVQKLEEAEALAAAGLGDLFLSNEVIDAAKLRRVAALAARVKLAIAVDSVLGIERLAAAMQAVAPGAAIDVFVEVDVGQGRCGVPPALAGTLARQVAAHAGLRFAGLQAYHGKAQHLRSVNERAEAIHHAAAMARAAQASVTAAGLACPLVTGAGTGSFVFEAASGLWGEVQAGSYVFMDADYAANAPLPGVPRFEPALFIKSQVISRAAAHAVIDAGHKAHALDSGPPTVWQRHLAWANGGDEHGILCLPPHGAGPALATGAPAAAATTTTDALPALGDTVWLLPGHCDPTVNLHDHLVAVRGGLAAGHVEALWPVQARGCLG